MKSCFETQKEVAVEATRAELLSVKCLFNAVRNLFRSMFKFRLSALSRLTYKAALVNLARRDDKNELRVIFAWDYGFIIVRIGQTSDVHLVGPNTSYQKLFAEQKELCPIEIPVDQVEFAVAKAKVILGREVNYLVQFAKAIIESRHEKKS